MKCYMPHISDYFWNFPWRQIWRQRSWKGGGMWCSSEMSSPHFSTPERWWSGRRWPTFPVGSPWKIKWRYERSSVMYYLGNYLCTPSLSIRRSSLSRCIELVRASGPRHNSSHTSWIYLLTNLKRYLMKFYSRNCSGKTRSAGQILTAYVNTWSPVTSDRRAQAWWGQRQSPYIHTPKISLPCHLQPYPLP